MDLKPEIGQVLTSADRHTSGLTETLIAVLT